MSYYRGYRRYSGSYSRRSASYSSSYSYREVVKSRYGGIDEDVRQIFFGLRESDRRRLFIKYATKYGEAKARYAEATYNKWRSEEVRMSGEISERLLDLLPPLLPFSVKHDLFSKLWHNLQPQRNIRVEVAPGFSVENVLNIITETVESTITHEIPESVRKQLNWLSTEDSQISAQLVKHFAAHEGKIIREQVADQLNFILGTADNNRKLDIHGTKTIQVGATRIDIIIKGKSLLGRLFMTDSNSQGRSDSGNQRSLVTQDLSLKGLTDLVKQLTPEQQGNVAEKAAQESLRLHVKQAESNLDSGITANKIDQVIDVAQRLAQNPTVSFTATAEHQGTRVTVRRGCFGVIVLLLCPFLVLLCSICV